MLFLPEFPESYHGIDFGHLHVVITLVTGVYLVFDLSDLKKELEILKYPAKLKKVFPFKKQFYGYTRLLFWVVLLVGQLVAFFTIYPEFYSKLPLLVASTFLILYLIRFVARKMWNYYRIELNNSKILIYEETSPFVEEIAEVDIEKAELIEIDQTDHPQMLNIVGNNDNLIIRINRMEQKLQDTFLKTLTQIAEKNNIQIKYV